MRLANVVAVGCLASLVSTSYMFVKISGFFVGFGFFGDPIMRRAVADLNRTTLWYMWNCKSRALVSNLDLNLISSSDFDELVRVLTAGLCSSLLKGIPTNAQLTITLLRIGERNAAPLPPSPTSPLNRPPTRRVSVQHEELEPLEATKSQVDRAVAPDPPLHEGAQTAPPPKKRSLGARMLGFFRSTAATGIESKFAVDRVRATAGRSPWGRSNSAVVSKASEVQW